MNFIGGLSLFLIGMLIGFFIYAVVITPTTPTEKPIYRYFISYSYGLGVGDIEITLPSPITCHNDLVPIRNFILPICKQGIRDKNPKIVEQEVEQHVQKIIITNWRQYP